MFLEVVIRIGIFRQSRNSFKKLSVFINTYETQRILLGFLKQNRTLKIYRTDNNDKKTIKNQRCNGKNSMLPKRHLRKDETRGISKTVQVRRTSRRLAGE